MRKYFFLFIGLTFSLFSYSLNEKPNNNKAPNTKLILAKEKQKLTQEFSYKNIDSTLKYANQALKIATKTILIQF